MRSRELFETGLLEHASVVEESLAALGEQFEAMLDAWLRTIRRGGKLMFLGNGGSAADAQHLATELTIRFAFNRPALAAMALSTDTSALTAAGNDLGFETIFARQVEALARSGDLVVALSTSGRSPNVIAALEQAGVMGVDAAAMTGGDGGQVVGLADPVIIVPSRITARIQEIHITLGHMLCGALEQALFATEARETRTAA